MDMVTIPKKEFLEMSEGLKILKKSELYERLLEFEKNLVSDGEFYREDLGF